MGIRIQRSKIGRRMLSREEAAERLGEVHDQLDDTVDRCGDLVRKFRSKYTEVKLRQVMGEFNDLNVMIQRDLNQQRLLKGHQEIKLLLYDNNKLLNK